MPVRQWGEGCRGVQQLLLDTKPSSPSRSRADGGRMTLSPYSADCLSMKASGKAR
jgi:hypothetical protein